MGRVSVTTDLFWLLRAMNRTSAGARGPPEAAATNLAARWAVPSSRRACWQRAGARPWMRPSESEQERGRCRSEAMDVSWPMQSAASRSRREAVDAAWPMQSAASRSRSDARAVSQSRSEAMDASWLMQRAR
jgi:hypothetical protein